MNVAGETALDVARRLKHSECEELVGGMEEWGRSSAWGEGTKAPEEGWHEGGGLLGRVPPVPYGLPHPEIPLTCPIPLAAGAGASREALPANPCGL